MRRSITQRIQRAKSNETRAEALHEWAHEWKAEHIEIIERLKIAIDENNMADIKISLGELRGVTEKKHEALHNVFDVLLSTKE